MFQQILVPLDGSKRAERVLSLAARLARVSGGTITLFTVMNSAHEVVLYHMTEPFLSPDTIERDRTVVQRYLDQVAQRGDLAGIALRKQVALGNPATMILSYAETRQIDLIVMCSHGYTGMKRWILGSVAEKVARHAPVPVFLLRDDELLRTHICANGMGSIRALVPLDASARAQDAIPPAAELVAALSEPEHGHLQFTQVVMVPEGAHADKREELLQEARQNLDAIGRGILEELVTHVGPDLHLTFSWVASRASDIAKGIVRIAENGEQLTGSSRSGTGHCCTSLWATLPSPRWVEPVQPCRHMTTRDTCLMLSNLADHPHRPITDESLFHTAPSQSTTTGKNFPVSHYALYCSA